MDMGESLVGSYMRAVRGCDSVTYNTFLPTGQGEIDVIGVRLAPTVEVFAAEVAIHLQGLEYGQGYQGSAAKVVQKMSAARAYCEQVYVGASVSLEFWSPNVPPGLVSKIAQHEEELGFYLVANAAFTERVKEHIAHAKASIRTTGEPAYRMLQILTHLQQHATLEF